MTSESQLKQELANADVARLRPATDADSPGVIAVITAVFDEYPGCILDVDREEPELRAPATCFDAFWVVESGAAIQGCVACARRTDARGIFIELKKMYLSRSLRGNGWGRRLFECVEGYARERGIRRIELWSDARFGLAHAVYFRLGFRTTGRTRELRDLSETTELHFVRE